MKKNKSFLFYLFTFFVTSFNFITNGFKRTVRFIHHKKRYAIPFYTFLGYVLFIIGIVKISGDHEYDKVLKNKRINDVTAINSIQVNKVIQPKSTEEIIEAIKNTTGPISIGGGKFSMGGQTGYENSLHIDTREFNEVLNLDVSKKIITVQPGVTWRDLQAVIDSYDLSVKIMQTYANFTVGGSISVNCHGRYIGHGPIISSVLGLKIITANGEVLNANRLENSEIFYAAIGGYGGIGVIVEVTLQLTDNVKVEREATLVKVKDYYDFFNNNIKNDKDVVFQNGDLYPPDFDLINNVSWRKTDKELTNTDRFTPSDENYWLERNMVALVSWGDFGKWLRKSIIDPVNYSAEKVVWRNKEASYDVNELEPDSRKDQTYVLQEYFIPVGRITSFIPKMKAIYEKYDVNVINVSLRHAYPDKESILSWADEEVFAFVIYYKQGTDPASREVVKQWTLEMTDAILSEDGKWYLPYQPHATVVQFQKAYPDSERYFELKNKFDATHRFTNQLLDKYNPYVSNVIYKIRDTLPGYFRAEEQTILTVPEWYLVFNPKEYADYLEDGNDPSDFPFYASVAEYWNLYDRSMKLVSEAYPENDEYKTMLQVIGVSVTIEYVGKLIYEKTLGTVFGSFSNGSSSDEEKLINQAHRAYSDFIYHTAWYEFEFMPWIRQVWAISDSSNGSWMRKTERTLFFTLEFSIKALYAEMIEWAAKNSYEEPVTDIYLIISGENTQLENVKVISEQEGKAVIAIPRWGEFTITLLKLAEKNIDILEIGGNDEIAISILLNEGEAIDFENIVLLFQSQMVTDQEIKRLVYFIPVDKLLPFIRYLQENSIEIEHIFDY